MRIYKKVSLVLANDSAFAGADELDKFSDVGVFCYIIGSKFIGDDAEVALFVQKEFFVSHFKGPAGVLGESAALQAYEVDASYGCWVSGNNGERWNVLRNAGASPNHAVFANTGKLVHGRESGDDGVVKDFAMPSQSGIVGEDAVVIHLALMTDVGVGEK